MSCFYHRDTSEIGSCDRCNRPVCSNCLLTFVNKKSYRSRPDPNERFDNYKDEMLSEENKEELHWCLPCYYTHFSTELEPQLGVSAISLWVLLDLLAFGLVAIILILFADYQYNLTISNTILSSPLYIIVIIFGFLAGFIILYQRRKKDLDEKIAKVQDVKDRFLEITNIGTIDEPITCYYCKHDISPDEFACMNLDCTLGENLDQNAKEIEIKAVNENYGFFPTLTKLPKIPEEKDDE